MSWEVTEHDMTYDHTGKDSVRIQLDKSKSPLLWQSSFCGKYEKREYHKLLDVLPPRENSTWSYILQWMEIEGGTGSRSAEDGRGRVVDEMMWKTGETRAVGEKNVDKRDRWECWFSIILCQPRTWKEYNKNRKEAEGGAQGAQDYLNKNRTLEIVVCSSSLSRLIRRFRLKYHWSPRLFGRTNARGIEQWLGWQRVELRGYLLCAR